MAKGKILQIPVTGNSHGSPITTATATIDLEHLAKALKPYLRFDQDIAKEDLPPTQEDGTHPEKNGEPSAGTQYKEGDLQKASEGKPMGS